MQKIIQRVSRGFCQAQQRRKIIVPEAITASDFDGKILLSSKSYNLIVDEGLRNISELYEHSHDTPSSVLKKTGLHLFPKEISYRVVNEKYNAYLKKLQIQYEKSYEKCNTPKEIFHMERRIKTEIKNRNKRIGVVEGRYKHYDMFKSVDQMREEKTLEEYKKKGVTIKALNNQTIYPTGMVWMPTNEQYLEHFLQYIDQYGGRPSSILDLGCGSGILSYICAKKYKKSQIVAVDKNPSAAETCSINAATLSLQNIITICTDILQQNQLQFQLKKEKRGNEFDLIVSNPPWITAKKLPNESPLADGVYDQKAQFLAKSMQFASSHLKTRQSRLLLVYSDLSSVLGLGQKTVEQLCTQYNLLIYSKKQKPLLQKLADKSSLSIYKQRAKILFYEIGKV